MGKRIVIGSFIACVACGGGNDTVGDAGLVCVAGTHACGSVCRSDSDPSACGAACAVCSTGGGTASCLGGRCAIACAALRGDCNRDATDGCEVDLSADLSNCGACGMACAGRCIGGACDPSRVLARDVYFQGSPLAVGSEGVYYQARNGLQLTPLDGGRPVLLSLDGPEVLVLTKDEVIAGCQACASLDGGVAVESALYALPRDGGSRRVLAILDGAPTAAAQVPGGVVVRERRTDLSGGVALVPLDGGTLTQLVTSVDSRGRSPGALAATADSFYYSSSDKLHFGRYDGGTAFVYANTAVSVAADATSMVFLEDSSRFLGTGGNATLWRSTTLFGFYDPLATGLASYSQVTIGDDGIYWVSSALSDGGPGGVFRVPVDGGAPARVATSRSAQPLISLSGIALDADAVYWVDQPGDRNTVDLVLLRTPRR